MTAQALLFAREDVAPLRLAEKVEEIVGEGFDIAKFAENFEVLAESAGGISQLRRLILVLAVRGILTGEARQQTAVTPDAEAPFQLPNRWTWRRLGDCAELSDGPFGSKLKSADYVPEAGFRVLRLGNIGFGEFKNDDQSFIAREHFDSLAPYHLHPGDVVVASLGNPSGRACAVPIEILPAINKADCFRVRVSASVSSRYLVLVLNSAFSLDRAAALNRGDTRGRITLSHLRDAPIPVPPLAEQKRIVAKVDELLALCDELEARQTKKREIGARLTKSALDALTSAEGPEEFDVAWKRVVDNFDVLFAESTEVEELRRTVLRLGTSGRLSLGGSADWAPSTVGDVADCRLGKMLDKVKNRGTSRPYLRNTNIHWFRLDLADIKQMLFEDRELEEYKLCEGDLLVCEGGHGIGRTAVWTGQHKTMMFQKALHRLRPTSAMNSTFLAFQLKVAADTGRMATYFTGAGIPHLTGRRLAEMPVIVPPIREQLRIVARIDQLMKTCDDLEARLRRSEDRAAKLAEAVVRELVA